MAPPQVWNNQKYFKYIQRKAVVAFFSYHLGSAAFLRESISEKQRVSGHMCVASGLKEEHWRPVGSQCKCGCLSHLWLQHHHPWGKGQPLLTHKMQQGHDSDYRSVGRLTCSDAAEKCPQRFHVHT